MEQPYLASGFRFKEWPNPRKAGETRYYLRRFEGKSSYECGCLVVMGDSVNWMPPRRGDDAEDIYGLSSPAEVIVDDSVVAHLVVGDTNYVVGQSDEPVSSAMPADAAAFLAEHNDEDVPLAKVVQNGGKITVSYSNTCEVKTGKRVGIASQYPKYGLSIELEGSLDIVDKIPELKKMVVKHVEDTLTDITNNL